MSELAAAAGQLPDALQPPVGRWIDAIDSRVAGRPTSELPDAASVVRLVACSEFAGQVIHRDAEHFFGQHRGDFALPDGASYSAEAAELFASAADRAGFARGLRVMRNRGLLRVMWADLVDQLPVADILRALSDLAEASIDAAVAYASQQLEARFGQPVDDDGVMPMIVLAMGKLGGRELNFSSDVDLIFLYPGKGETNGKRVLSAPEYFARLARETIALLEQVTADGFVYRVDTRLRPFGDSGPPVVSLAALESYLVEHGRGWERYAYVKARPVTRSAGSPHAVRLMENTIRPFVYRRYLDYGVFESLRDLHKLITAEIDRQDRLDNLKLGPGGIREIEFIAQSLQLVRGGSAAKLQTTGLREALAAAVSDNSMREADGSRLITAYDFLRRLENAIQYYRDQQTHDLPGSDEELERLAFAVACPNREALAEELRTTRQWVSERFDEIGVRDGGDEDSERLAYDRLWATGAAEDEWLQLLETQGFGNAPAVAAAIADFLRRQSARRVERIGARRLRECVSRMLQAVREAADPALVLGRLIAIVEAVLRRSAYLSLLNENPVVLKRLVELCEKSIYLAEEIARHPALLDELIDGQIFVDPPTAEDIEASLSEALAEVADDDVENRIEALAEFKRTLLFRIAVADFSGSMPIMKVSDRLTDIAERILGEALALAEMSVTQQFGRPTCVVNGQRRNASLGIIAYGKLAGFELSYSSDLDLVFIHDSTGREQVTDGDKPIDNNLYFSRVVRRLIHILTTQTGFGALYEIDTRLRPSGNSGLLVASLDAFTRYQHESAWTWEHQALLRSRPVAGSETVARAFAEIREQTLKQRVRRSTLRDEVTSMRRKMRKNLDRSTSEVLDLKQGRGGIADVEFLVQYLVLQHAGDDSSVIKYPDNIRQLDALAESGYMDRQTVDSLQRNYRQYRARVHRLALDGRPALVPAAEFSAERQLVVAEWRRVFAGPANPD